VIFFICLQNGIFQRNRYRENLRVEITNRKIVYGFTISVFGFDLTSQFDDFRTYQTLRHFRGWQKNSLLLRNLSRLIHMAEIGQVFIIVKKKSI
jgi:transposase-like protein